MGWPARGAHIASKWWGCPSACLAIVAADRRGAPWVAVASTGCPPPCSAATWFLARRVLVGVLLVPWRRVHIPLAPMAAGGPGSLAVGSVAVVVCACSKTGCTPHVLPHLLAGGARFGWPHCACGSPGVICLATPVVVGMGRGVCPLVGGLSSGSG